MFKYLISAFSFRRLDLDPGRRNKTVLGSNAENLSRALYKRGWWKCPHWRRQHWCCKYVIFLSSVLIQLTVLHYNTVNRCPSTKMLLSHRYQKSQFNWVEVAKETTPWRKQIKKSKSKFSLISSVYSKPTRLELEPCSKKVFADEVFADEVQILQVSYRYFKADTPAIL